MRTKIDALASALSVATGRSETEVLLALRGVILPRLARPEEWLVPISEAEYAAAREIGEVEREGILKWLKAVGGDKPLFTDQN